MMKRILIICIACLMMIPVCHAAGAHDDAWYQQHLNDNLNNRPAASGCIHDWTEWECVFEALEEEPGLEERVCALCGKLQEREIPSLADQRAEEEANAFVPDETMLIWRHADENGNETREYVTMATPGLMTCAVVDQEMNVIEVPTIELVTQQEKPMDRTMGYLLTDIGYERTGTNRFMSGDSISAGVIVFVLDDTEELLHLLYKNQITYIYPNGIVYYTPQAETPYKRAVVIDDGYGTKARVFIKPTEGATEVTKISGGAEVIVYNAADKWCFIEYEGMVGYAHQEQLTFYLPEEAENEIEGAYIIVNEDNPLTERRPWFPSSERAIVMAGEEYDIIGYYRDYNGTMWYRFDTNTPNGRFYVSEKSVTVGYR